jgi:hypothetical protein
MSSVHFARFGKSFVEVNNTKKEEENSASECDYGFFFQNDIISFGNIYTERGEKG